MSVKFLIQAFKEEDYRGRSRHIVSNEAELKLVGFDNDIASLKIMRGPDFQPGDVVRLYTDKGFSGKYIEVGPGEYPSVHKSPIDLGHKISSIEITSVHIPAAPAVPLIVQVFADKNFEGRRRTIVQDLTDLKLQDFDDDVSSLQVFAGPDHAGEVATFFQNPNFSGFSLEPADMGPGTSIPNLKEIPNKLNNRISSIRIHLPGK